MTESATNLACYRKTICVFSVIASASIICLFVLFYIWGYFNLNWTSSTSISSCIYTQLNIKYNDLYQINRIISISTIISIIFNVISMFSILCSLLSNSDQAHSIGKCGTNSLFIFISIAIMNTIPTFGYYVSFLIQAKPNCTLTGLQQLHLYIFILLSGLILLFDLFILFLICKSLPNQIKEQNKKKYQNLVTHQSQFQSKQHKQKQSETPIYKIYDRDRKKQELIRQQPIQNYTRPQKFRENDDLYPNLHPKYRNLDQYEDQYFKKQPNKYQSYQKPKLYNQSQDYKYSRTPQRNHRDRRQEYDDYEDQRDRRNKRERHYPQKINHGYRSPVEQLRRQSPYRDQRDDYRNYAQLSNIPVYNERNESRYRSPDKKLSNREGVLLNLIAN